MFSIIRFSFSLTIFSVGLYLYFSWEFLSWKLKLNNSIILNQGLVINNRYDKGIVVDKNFEDKASLNDFINRNNTTMGALLHLRKALAPTLVYDDDKNKGQDSALKKLSPKDISKFISLIGFFKFLSVGSQLLGK